jgi:hypothetical protein
VVVLLAGAGCADTTITPALRVGDRVLSESDLLDELAEWAGNLAATGAPEPIRGQVEASYPADFVAAIIGFRIERELVLAEAERLGLEPTDELIDQARLAFYGDPRTAQQVEAGWSPAYAQRLLREIATELALEAELGPQGMLNWRTEAIATTRIEVSSRFGRWDPQAQQVVPPAGPEEPAGPDPLAGM